MKRSLILTLLVATSFAGLGVYAGVSKWTPAPALPAAVSMLFAETLPDAGGTAQALKQWQGKTLIVNFWATWCTPCVKEMPELSALQGQLTAAGKGGQVIGVGIDSANNITEFSKRFQISYPLLAAGMGGAKLTRAFGNQAGGLPFTVVIGPDGQIRKTILGVVKFDELRAELGSLLVKQ